MLQSSRLATLVWLILWVTTTPLFHIHVPDVTNDAGWISTGLAHTVFSADLPGEYARSFNMARVTHNQRVPFHISQHVANYPEMGIALLSDSDDRRTVRSPLSSTRASITTVELLTPYAIRLRDPDRFSRPCEAFASLTSRAPPHIFS